MYVSSVVNGRYRTDERDRPPKHTALPVTVRAGITQNMRRTVTDPSVESYHMIINVSGSCDQHHMTFYYAHLRSVSAAGGLQKKVITILGGALS